jgi:predicted  nucleic acid-binding Zn-ribbon protein
VASAGLFSVAIGLGARKTMNRLLFELQEADTLITQLKRERGKLDDGTHARSERDTLQKAHDAERTRLSVLNGERNDKELQLKSTEEKIARQQSRLMTATNSHEVTALQRDIKALGNMRGDFDEAILNLMDEIETTSTRLKELENELNQKADETRFVEKQFAVETARLERELSAAHKLREELAAKLDAAALNKYQAVADKHHGVAVAHPDKGNCSACGMALTPFNLKEAKTQEWPTCESCGRLLFIG